MRNTHAVVVSGRFGNVDEYTMTPDTVGELVVRWTAHPQWWYCADEFNRIEAAKELLKVEAGVDKSSQNYRDAQQFLRPHKHYIRRLRGSDEVEHFITAAEICNMPLEKLEANPPKVDGTPIEEHIDRLSAFEYTPRHNAGFYAICESMIRGELSIDEDDVDAELKQVVDLLRKDKKLSVKYVPKRGGKYQDGHRRFYNVVMMMHYDNELGAFKPIDTPAYYHNCLGCWSEHRLESFDSSTLQGSHQRMVTQLQHKLAVAKEYRQVAGAVQVGKVIDLGQRVFYREGASLRKEVLAKYAAQINPRQTGELDMDSVLNEYFGTYVPADMLCDPSSARYSHFLVDEGQLPVLVTPGSLEPGLEMLAFKQIPDPRLESVSESTF